MSLKTQLAIARHEIASYREYYQILHQEAMEVRDWEEIVDKGLRTHHVIIDTDEYYRDRMAQAEAPYQMELDATGLTLLTDWTRFSEFVLSHIQPFEAKGYDIERAAEFRQLLTQTRAVLSPPDKVVRMAAWQAVIRRTDEFLQQLPEPGAVDIDSEFWLSVPILEVVSELRRHNLAARGLDAEEVAELSDLSQYPGTMLGELQQHYWHSRNSATPV